MLKVIKRDEQVVEFDGEKIIEAIVSAMEETSVVDVGIAEEIAKEVKKEAKHHVEMMGRHMTVEQIQDKVESCLMEHGQYDAAKRYILYRDEHRKVRDEWKPYKEFNYLSTDFLKKYAYNPNPFNSELSKFTFYRTYSRFLPEVNRRETWLEMNARVVDYIMELDPKGNKEKAEELFDYMFNFKVFSSGRIRYTGGTRAIKRNFQSAFNCSYITMDNIFNLVDAMYLLMLGSGVGYRILFEDVEKMQPVRQDIEVIHKSYEPVNSNQRQELTTTNLHNNNILEIVVGDSKNGWVNALRVYLEYLTNYKSSSNNKIVNTILFNYDNVRPQGERLKTFGGTASGHKPLKKAFEGINRVINESSGKKLSRDRVKLKPIDVLDMNGLIAQAIVVGGVRRSAEIALISPDDYESRNAKTNLYTQVDGDWKIDNDIAHRQMSNNTILYDEKPTRKELHEHIKTLKTSGEPAIANLEEMKRRKPEAEGLNPCAEILLQSKQHCNLTAINMMAFVNENGNIDYDDMERAQELATYMAFIISMQELDLYEWGKVAKDDRIIGISTTGLQDFFNKSELNDTAKDEVLKFLRKVAHSMNTEVARENNLKEANLVTTQQPAGTVSILPDSVSSGVHWSHSPYYIRRVRVSSNDPLAKAMVDSGFDWKPEVGQTEEEHSTKVFEFPVKAPKGKTKYDVSAIEQLNEYKRLMKNYVDHNASITVHVRENEWEDVEEWLWNNWDDFVGISFLSLDDSFYELLPYESVSENRYNEMKNKIPELNIKNLEKYETGKDFEIDEGAGCDDGHCPVR